MLSTVSHWNLIHMACHEAARRADAHLRPAKAELEGATLRNGGTLTNNILPVRPFLDPLKSQVQVAIRLTP